MVRGYGYEVGNTGLRLRPPGHAPHDSGAAAARRGWRVESRTVWGQRWLARHGLDGEAFVTRADAHRVLVATLAIDDTLVGVFDPEPLVRVSAGVYRSADGAWEATRYREACGLMAWQMHETATGERVSWRLRSLRTAAECARGKHEQRAAAIRTFEEA